LEYSKNQTDVLLNDVGYDLLEECRQAVTIAGIDRDAPVLDVATGSGRMASVLSEFGHVVYSGDISCDAFLKVRDRLGGLVDRRMAFVLLDAAEMPFLDESFRAIVCANALHEMREPKAVLSEMIRLCSRNGRLIVTDFNDKGFEMMAQVHLQTHGREHSRGSITADEISHNLSLHFADVQHHSLALNHLWIASGKVTNADTGIVHSTCFACGDRNPQGLGLGFRPIGKHRVSTECALGEEYQGYPGIVQGGIVSTLLDSAMTNCLFSDGIEAMTVRLYVRFSEPVLVSRKLTVSACLIRQRGRFYELKAWIMQDNKQKASAEGKFLADRGKRG